MLIAQAVFLLQRGQTNRQMRLNALPTSAAYTTGVGGYSVHAHGHVITAYRHHILHGLMTILRMRVGSTAIINDSRLHSQTAGAGSVMFIYTSQKGEKRNQITYKVWLCSTGKVFSNLIIRRVTTVRYSLEDYGTSANIIRHWPIKSLFILVTERWARS